MKPEPLFFLTFGTLGLMLPAAADVIYSNLQDIAIPATSGDYLGWYIDDVVVTATTP